MFICIVIFTQSTEMRRQLKAQAAAGLFHTQESGEPLNLSPLLEGLRVVE